MNKSIQIEIYRLMVHLTLNERLEMAALEMENLRDITAADPWRRSIIEDIEDRNYSRAKQKATGNWEPPDPPGFEGGFADNH